LKHDNLKLKQTLKVLKYYLMDVNGKIVNHDPYSNNLLNPFKLNWYFLHHNYHHNYCEEIFTIINNSLFVKVRTCLVNIVFEPIKLIDIS
jgi:DNA-directed RNA polymerase subunit beta'